MDYLYLRKIIQLKKPVFFLLLIFTVCLKNVLAKEVTKQNLLWFAYFNTIQFTPKWSSTFDIQERIFTDKLKQHQLVFREQINFHMPKQWVASIGFTYFLQSPHNPYSSSNLMVPELRPHIQLSNRNTINDNFFVQHQYRIEKRFFRNATNSELISGYNTNYRFRYQLSLNYNVFKIKKQPVTLRVSNEIHINAGKTIVKNVFDQNRIYTGINFRISEYLTVETGYLNWFQQRASGNEFFNRNIFRVTVNQTINLVKK